MGRKDFEMKYADINKKYTAIIAEYLANGYTINTRTMGGSQGDYAHIDLTNGTEVIRILVETFHEWGKLSIEGLEIIVGRADSEVIPNCESDYCTLWNNRLDIISRVMAVYFLLMSAYFISKSFLPIASGVGTSFAFR